MVKRGIQSHKGKRTDSSVAQKKLFDDKENEDNTTVTGSKKQKLPNRPKLEKKKSFCELFERGASYTHCIHFCIYSLAAQEIPLPPRPTQK